MTKRALILIVAILTLIPAVAHAQQVFTTTLIGTTDQAFLADPDGFGPR